MFVVQEPWVSWTSVFVPPMSKDEKIHSHRTKADDAFSARMRKAIAAGLESAPIGVPGTQSPKSISAEPRLPASPSGNTTF